MAQNLEVSTSPLQKNILAPSSYDFTLRLMFLAGLYPGSIILQNFNQSPSIVKVLDCFQMIGLSLTRTEEAIIFHSSFPACETQGETEAPISLDIGLKNEVLYFLMAFLIRGRGKYIINASLVKEEEDFPDESFEKFLKTLENLKVKVKTGGTHLFPIEIQGPAVFHHREVELADPLYDEKTFEALSLCFSDTPLLFSLKNKIPSAQILLTQNIIKTFYFEKTNQNLSFFIPLDFKQVSYMALLALMKGELILRNCPYIDLMQPDSLLFSLIKRMNGHVNISNQGLYVKEQLNSLKPLSWDISHSANIIPGIIALCSKIKGKSCLENLNILEKEEKKHCLKLLEHFEVSHKYDNSSDRLIIEGQNKELTPYKEYSIPRSYPWIGMAAYLLMRTNSGGKLCNIEEMNESYPEFLQLII